MSAPLEQPESQALLSQSSARPAMPSVATQRNAGRSWRPPRTYAIKAGWKMRGHRPTHSVATDTPWHNAALIDAGPFLRYGLKTDHLISDPPHGRRPILVVSGGPGDPRCRVTHERAVRRPLQSRVKYRLDQAVSRCDWLELTVRRHSRRATSGRLRPWRVRQAQAGQRKPRPAPTQGNW